MKGTTSKHSIEFFSSIFSLFLVSYLVSLSNLFFLSLFFFLILGYVFLCNIHVFSFKTNNLKNHQFLVNRGVCNKTLFVSTCVLQNVKSCRFLGGPFLGKFWVMSKNTIKVGISAHF